jgi:penicillin-binding protein 1A
VDLCHPEAVVRRLSRGIIQLVAVVTIGGLVTGACIAALIPSARDLAAANRASGGVSDAMSPLSQRTTVYANDGLTEIGLLGLEDRQYATLDEVPQVVIDAVVATEDRTFWENPGFDLRSVLRALDENISKGRITQGGSTVTQQLAKLRLVGLDRDLNRKARELVMAYRINEELSKEQILEQYLNTVYFGQGSYGIKTAASRFFTIIDPLTGLERPKRLDELDLADAALLAGNIQNPEGANPFLAPDRALRRRNEVLWLMHDEGYITDEDVWLAAQVPLPTTLPPAELRPDNYFVEEVQRRLLEDERLGDTPDARENAVLRGGLRVISTLDLTAQFNAQVAVNTVLPDQPPFTGALVAMDPETGAVKAVVGGPGFEESQYNLATQPPGRQPGSVYKIITLAAALEAGYSPNDTISGSSPCLIEGYGRGGLGRGPARNAEGGGGTTTTLRAQTTRSVNCAFLRLTEALGVDKIAEMAHRLGIPDIEGIRVLPTTPNVTSITLGSIEASPLEIATVGSALTAGGVRYAPIFYERVLGPGGEILIDNTTPVGERVVSADVATCTVDVMRDAINNGTGTAARIDRDAAGKTGTTDNRTDAWFLGMTPGLVAAVWRGAPNAQVSGAGFGGQYPAQVWRAFMTAELEDEPKLEFPPPGPSCSRPGTRIASPGSEPSPPVPVVPSEPAPDVAPEPEAPVEPPVQPPPAQAASRGRRGL